MSVTAQRPAFSLPLSSPPMDGSVGSLPHRQTGFRISERSSNEIRQEVSQTGGISPHLLHSPHAVDYRSLVASVQSNAIPFNLGSPSSAMQQLDLIGEVHGSPSHARYGSLGHSVPRYFAEPQSAAPHEIFSPRPETHTNDASSLADSLSASLHDDPTVMGHHRRQSSTGKAPSAVLQARSSRRFSVSSASNAAGTKAEVAANIPVRWFDQPTAIDDHHTPGGESDLFTGQWNSPLVSAAIDMGNIQSGGQRGFMPSSAPASSTSFQLGRAPHGRARQDTIIPSSLSEVGEEDLNLQLAGVPTTDKRRKRRESHNLVERRRRDHINQAISDLAHLVPAMMLEPAPGATGLTHHHVHNGNTAILAASPTFAVDEGSSALLKPNKGLILERSVDYIKLLQQQVQTLSSQCSALQSSVDRLGGDASSIISSSQVSGAGSPAMERSGSGSNTLSESSGGISVAEHLSDYMEH